MKLFRFLVVGCLVVALVGCNPKPSGPAGGGTGGGRGAQDNKGGGGKTGGDKTAVAAYKDKILGKWALEKSSAKQGPPPGTTVEYSKDGKVKLTMKGPDGKAHSMEGTYAVDGEKLKTTMKVPGGKENTDTDTITKLTDTQLVIKDGRTGDTVEFMKK